MVAKVATEQIQPLASSSEAYYMPFHFPLIHFTWQGSLLLSW